MAITHTETVTDLTVLNDGTDVVSIINITTVSVDDSDPSNLTRTFYAVSYTHLTLPTSDLV